MQFTSGRYKCVNQLRYLVKFNFVSKTTLESTIVCAQNICRVFEK